MKKFCCVLLFVSSASVFAGRVTDFSTSILDPPRWEISVESGYLLGVAGNPDNYEVAPQFITARVRWGVVDRDDWLRGYNQFYISAEAQPITRGIENFYYGLNFGLRYNFVRPNSHFVPFVSGGLGLGWIDSHPDFRGSQGQDFTFNILAAIGITYKIDNHWSVSGAVLYEHFSNGGQTDPNPSLNLLGPQLGLNYSF